MVVMLFLLFVLGWLSALLGENVLKEVLEVDTVLWALLVKLWLKSLAYRCEHFMHMFFVRY